MTEIEVTFLEPCDSCASRVAEWLSGPAVLVPPELLSAVGRLAGAGRGRLTGQERERGRRLVELLTGLADDLLGEVDAADAVPAGDLLVVRPCRDCAAMAAEYQGAGETAIVAEVRALAALVRLVSPDRPPLDRKQREAADTAARMFRRAAALHQRERRRARIHRLAGAQARGVAR